MKNKATKPIKNNKKIHFIMYFFIFVILLSLGFLYMYKEDEININMHKKVSMLLINQNSSIKKYLNFSNNEIIEENNNSDNDVTTENTENITQGNTKPKPKPKPKKKKVIKKGKGKGKSKNKGKSINKNKSKGKNILKNKVNKSNNFIINESYSQMNIIKKEPYFDRYGIDLNEYIMDGMLNKAINNNTEASIEDWDLYTPPCPNLHPVHYSEEISNPVCENIGVPLYKMTSKGSNFYNLPLVLRLNSITSQMENWEKFRKSESKFPNYRNASMDELVNDEYHPFDYGYYNYEINEDEDYYKKVVNSSMDEVPDPRRRRLFSMILFNSEFELLDLYLSEYYEIVDYFIIYESNSTFSGYKKPLYLTRTLLETNRYKNYRDKIIPITLPVLDVKSYDQRGPGFPREHLARREVIEKGLRAVHARHGDMFIHGDLDEMPKARLLSYLKKCGGWEHLQMGIGGGPKPINDPETKSFIYDRDLPVTTNYLGQYQIDYKLKPSIPFAIFFYEYSFHMVKDRIISNLFHPNLSIFDARRALGQYPEFNNDGSKFNINEKHIFSRSFVDNDDDIDNDYEIERYDDDIIDENENEIENNNDDYDTNDDINDDGIEDDDIKDDDIEDEDEMINDYIDISIENENKNDYTREDNRIHKRDIQKTFNISTFDPYIGYTYSDNTNDYKVGEGYLGEYEMRFNTSIKFKNNKVINDRENFGLWKSGWHLSSFLPNVQHFFNKVASYSHYNEYNEMSDENKKKEMINRIHKNLYIFGNNKTPMQTIKVRIPVTEEEKSPDMYSYNMWSQIYSEYNETGKSHTFIRLNSRVLHEIPRQVMENPICYAYMLDRNFGFTKKLWWEVIPKEDWDTVDFDTLDPRIKKQISPKLNKKHQVIYET